MTWNCVWFNLSLVNCVTILFLKKVNKSIPTSWNMQLHHPQSQSVSAKEQLCRKSPFQKKENNVKWVRRVCASVLTWEEKHVIGKKRENCSIEPTSFSTSISFNYLLLEATQHYKERIEKFHFNIKKKSFNFFFFSYCKHHQHIIILIMITWNLNKKKWK